MGTASPSRQAAMRTPSADGCKLSPNSLFFSNGPKPRVIGALLQRPPGLYGTYDESLCPSSVYSYFGVGASIEVSHGTSATFPGRSQPSFSFSLASCTASAIVASSRLAKRFTNATSLVPRPRLSAHDTRETSANGIG